MSTPVTGSISWQTPVTVNSGDIVTSTDLNNLNKDVAFLHARPWTIINQTSNGTALTSSGAAQVLFGGSGSGAIATLNSTTAVGTIGNSSGTFTVPLAGMYRINASVGVIAAASIHFRIRVVGQNTTGGTTTAVWQYLGNEVTGSSITPANPVMISLVSVFMPVGTYSSSVPFGNANSFYVAIDSFSSASTVPVGTQSTTVYPTTVQIEYTGTSAGAY
jgi:hypothetical protein